MCGDSNPMLLRLLFEPGVRGDVSASFQRNFLLQDYDGMRYGFVIIDKFMERLHGCGAQ